MIFSAANIAGLAQLLPRGDAPEALAAVRIRAVGLPQLKGESLALVEWAGEATWDALREQLVEAMEQLDRQLRADDQQLPPTVRVRLDCLDGAGSGIPGWTVSRTFQTAVTVQTATPTSSPVQPAPLPSVPASMAAFALGPMAPMAEAVRFTQAGAALDQAAGGGATVPLSLFLGVCFFTVQQAHIATVEANKQAREMSGQVVKLTEIVGQNARHKDSMLRDMVRSQLDSTAAAARAEADVAVAMLSKDLEHAQEANGSTEPDRFGQALEMLRELPKTASTLMLAQDLKVKRAAAAARQAASVAAVTEGAPTAPASTPAAPAAPPPPAAPAAELEEEEPNELGLALDLLMSGTIPPEMLAMGILQSDKLTNEQKLKLVKLGGALKQLTDAESPPIAAAAA